MITTTNGLCNEPDCLLCGGVRMMRAMAAVPSVADLKPGPIEPADLPPSAFIRMPPESLSFDNLLSKNIRAGEAVKRLPWTLAQHQRWTRVALRSSVAAFAPVMGEGERAFALWLFGKWVEERQA